MKISNPGYSSILTHNDLDGIASAALCAEIYQISDVFFSGPASVDRMPVTSATIVCDLPYPKECGLWFDHHIANGEELKLRGVNSAELPGKLEEKPSCLHVIYDYFKSQTSIDHWEPFVNAVDKLDGFQYRSVEEWREKTPEKILDACIKSDYNDKNLLRELVKRLQSGNYQSTARDTDIRAKAEAYFKSESSQQDLIRKNGRYLDDCNEIAIINLTDAKKPVTLQKNLAFIHFTEASAVLEVRCLYESGRKTNHLNFSMSLGFVPPAVKKKKDIGEIMRKIGIGSGHPGAASGQVRCGSKAARQEAEIRVLGQIQEFWKEQTV